MRSQSVGGILIISALVGVVSVSRLGLADRSGEPGNCGPLSLLVALQCTGQSVDFSMLNSLLPAKQDLNGCSFFELQAAAVKLGVRTKLTNISFEDLVGHEGTAVILVDGNHFVAVTALKGSSIQMDKPLIVHDPNDSAVRCGKADIESRWNGEALLVYRDQEERSGEPNPALDALSFFHDVGEVLDAEAITQEFVVKNIGSEPLNLKVVGTSCGCLTANISDSSIGPGKSATVELIVDPKKVNGKFSVSAAVESNDPKRRLVSFALAGYYSREIVATKSIKLGRLIPGSKSKAYLPIRNISSNRIRIEHINSIDRFSNSNLVVQAVVTNNTPPDVRRQFKMLPSEKSIEFTVSVPRDCEPGQFSDAFNVSTEMAASSFTLNGTVVDGLNCQPSVLVCFLDGANIRCTKEIVVSDLGQFPIGKVSLKNSQLVKCSVINETYHETKVVITLSIEFLDGWNREGNEKAVLDFELESGKQFSVPVLGVKR